MSSSIYSKNTVLLIEPRKLDEVVLILYNAYESLGDKWNYVFYCGKSLKYYWEEKLPKFIEIRPLEVENFIITEYSDFCKSIDLWKSLTGEYVLTTQLDTWIINKEPYTIDYFIKMKKSYIGGNQDIIWGELLRENINPPIRNFNGGFSLRKREDMIKIIQRYPPQKVLECSTCMENSHEDVYFVIGCYRLGYTICDDNISSHFAVHLIYKDEFFGMHQPHETIREKMNEKYPFLGYINKYLRLVGN